MRERELKHLSCINLFYCSVKYSFSFRLSEHMEAETNLEAKFQNDFIMQQILEVAALLDFSDEVGRLIELACFCTSFVFFLFFVRLFNSC